MIKNTTENIKDPNSKNLACVSWHSTLPPNTGANVRIRNILFNLNTIKPIFLSPEPKDADLQHYTFEPFKAPNFINQIVPFNLEILSCIGSRVKKQVLGSIQGSEISCVLCEHLWSFPLARKISIELKVPLVLVEHVVETVYAMRNYNSRLLGKFTSSYERNALEKSDRIITVSKFDKESLINKFQIPGEKIWVVPNGVILPDENSKINYDATLDELKNYTIVMFLGKTSVTPNAEAISIIENKILPLVKAKNKNIVFMIVGGPGQKDFSRLNEGFVYTGFVDSVFPYLHRADICIAPLKSHSGMPLKILEYASFGKPLVATSLAVEGIDFKDGQELLVRDDWGDFADAILYLIEDSEKLKNLGKSALNKIKREYQWNNISNNFEKKLINLINGYQD